MEKVRRVALLCALQRPLYCPHLHFLAHDARVNGIQKLSRPVYRSFLSSKFIRYTPAVLLGLLNLEAVQPAQLQQLNFSLARAVLSFEALLGFGRTLIGRFEHSNCFLDELRKSDPFRQQSRLVQQFKIPYPNSAFHNESKIKLLQLKANIKLMKASKIGSFYSFDVSLPLFLEYYFQLHQRFSRKQLEQLGYYVQAPKEEEEQQQLLIEQYHEKVQSLSQIPEHFIPKPGEKMEITLDMKKYDFFATSLAAQNIKK